MTRRDLAGLVALTVLYVAAGRLGLGLAFSVRQISPVWPPTGLALAALLAFGLRFWPAILAGAFLVNVPTGESVPTAMAIAIGNTLEAVVGAALLRRVGFDRALQRLRDVFALVLLGALAAPAVAATIGVISLWADGLLARPALAHGWWVWWVGDAVGALTVTPLLLAWRMPVRRPSRQRLTEGLLLFLALAATCLAIFAFDQRWPSFADQLQYLVFPFLIWSAVRFGQRETTLGLALISSIAIWGALHGRGPFGLGTLNARLVLLQTFMAVVSVTALALAATTSERRRAQEALAQRDQERAQLLEREKAARAAAEKAEEQASVVAEASALLAASIDYETTLQAVSRAAVPRLADWCVVDVVEEGGRISRVASAAARPDSQALLAELQRLYPPTLESPQPAAEALRARRAVFYRKMDAATLANRTRDEGHARIIDALGPRSVIAVPMLARDELLGAITFAYAESGRTYELSDVAIAEELARRAAVAVDHARLYRQAQELNRSKDAFLATLSHELRTPLTPILGWTRLLRDQPFDEAAVRRALEVIDRNVRLQAQLIEDLLDMSRILAGKMRLLPRRLPAAAAVQSAVDSLRPSAEAKGLRLETRLDPSLVLWADPERFQQVVANLVSNAVKFTSEGKVEVALQSAPPWAELVVRDTGQGVPAEFLPRMFRPFSQADDSTTRAHGGLGLGLAIVREIVERHGGSIVAESPGRGKGTTLWVSLPLAADTAEEPAPARVDRQQRRRALSGIHVLAVDDDSDARDLLGATLARFGAVVHGASSADEALEALDREAFDVLVSDIGMPQRDGYDLIQAVRARPAERGGSLPAIALTAYAHADDRARALEAGFQVHVPKPVDPDRLVDAVASLVQRPA